MICRANNRGEIKMANKNTRNDQKKSDEGKTPPARQKASDKNDAQVKADK